MYTKVVFPDTLTGEELDVHLEGGWFRVGNALMTCRLMVLDDHLRSAIWTRLPLEGYRFKASHRKRMARLARKFDVRTGPMDLDVRKTELYSKYLAAVPDRPKTLGKLLGSRTDLFNTRELTIWDGDRLVGFSLFDLGDRTMQSLAGVYDPAYAKDSVGFYTMQLEVQHAMKLGLDAHYAGYILPGDTAWDYKLRLGALEFLDSEHNTWRPIRELDTYASPGQRMRAALQTLSATLLQAGIPHTVERYRLFQMAAYNPRFDMCLAHPSFVACPIPDASDNRLVITYDMDRGAFELLHCRHVRAELLDEDGDPIGKEPDVDIWLQVQSLRSFNDPAHVAVALTQLKITPKA